jgi:EPS-associated MarR family transcriptional regulator
MIKFQSITEDQLDLMHIIQGDTNASQRQLAQETGLSIGKVNYCLKALIDIGFIKVDSFNKSTQKINYAYILTPKGIKEKAAITKQFIIKKKQEYDKLNSYVN